MNLELKTLDIVHFKGIRRLHLDFHEGVNSIYGENAAGKTSIYDALTWLLFDKDSHGNSKFDIKPHGDSAGGMPEVTAVLLADGVPIKLKKVLREKWEKPRGAVVAQYGGDTRDYFIDDVPRKENEYKRMIAGYIDEKQFKILTNVFAVTREMHWKDRRALLAEICGLPDDAKLLAENPDFAELAEQAGRRTVEEYKAALQTERKGINSKLSGLPDRIDECERDIVDLVGIDFAAARQQEQAFQQEREHLQNEIARLENDTLKAELDNRYQALKLKLQTLELENHQHRASQDVPVVDESEALRKAFTEAKSAESKAEKRAADLIQNLQDSEARLDAYRARWKAIHAEQFAESTCPTCGQTLPPDKLQEARKRFEESQQTRKNGLLEDSQLIKSDMAQRKAELAQLQQDLPRMKARTAQAEQRFTQYMPPEKPVIEDLPDYEARRSAILQQMQAVTERLEVLQASKQEARDDLTAKLHAVTAKILESNVVTAKETQLIEKRQRIAELHAEQRAQASTIEQLDRMIALCESFARFRAQTVESCINGRFRLARFRLFAEQVNGGLADCCEVVDDKGVSFESVNDAMKVNMGIDIIDTLSEHYGKRVPLFVDNAESVTRLAFIRSQVVRLVVREQDKELRQE